MLNEEYKKGNISWYNDGVCKYKIEEFLENAVVWINLGDYDIATRLLLWDFQKEIEENDIVLKLNTKWSPYVGFEMHKDNVFVFIGLVAFFIARWEQDVMNTENKYNDWYS